MVFLFLPYHNPTTLNKTKAFILRHLHFFEAVCKLQLNVCKHIIHKMLQIWTFLDQRASLYNLMLKLQRWTGLKSRQLTGSHSFFCNCILRTDVSNTELKVTTEHTSNAKFCCKTLCCKCEMIRQQKPKLVGTCWQLVLSLTLHQSNTLLFCLFSHVNFVLSIDQLFISLDRNKRGVYVR